MDEQLLDFARDAHALRVAGYSERAIARAAGLPELAELYVRLQAAVTEPPQPTPPRAANAR